MPKVQIADLTKAVQKYLEEYAEDIEDDVQETVDKITEEAKEELAVESEHKFKQHGRKQPYHRGWAVKLSKKQPQKYHKVIWNRTNYQLTHLLEFGHATRNGGRTKAVPHIRPVEEKYKKEFLKQIEEKIRRES